MDISSLNTLLPAAQTPVSQDSSVASAATDGTTPDPTQVSSSAGQDLPTADQGTAASATSGASTATLSPEIQALLLQSQEASAAVSYLDGGLSDQDPLLAALGDPSGSQSTASTSPTLDQILAELQGQGTSSSQSGSNSTDLDAVLAALQGTDSAQTSNRTTLSDVLSALQGTDTAQTGTQSADSTSSIDAMLAALQGSSTTSQDPLLATGTDSNSDVMQSLMQSMGISSSANSSIDNTTQSLLNLMNSGGDGETASSDPMLASLE